MRARSSGAGLILAGLLLGLVLIGAGLYFAVTDVDPADVAAGAPTPPPTSPEPPPAAPAAPAVPVDPSPPPGARADLEEPAPVAEPTTDLEPAPAEDRPATPARELPAAALAQRIEQARAAGDARSAEADMAVYVERFDGDPRARAYAQILERRGPPPARPSAEPPQLRIRLGDPTIRGSFSRDLLRRVVTRHLGELRACYASALERDSSLSGRVTVRMTLSPAGSVESAEARSSTTGDPPLDGCLLERVRRWRFPAGPGGGVTIVDYPFVLSTA